MLVRIILYEYITFVYRVQDYAFSLLYLRQKIISPGYLIRLRIRVRIFSDLYIYDFAINVQWYCIIPFKPSIQCEFTMMAMIFMLQFKCNSLHIPLCIQLILLFFVSDLTVDPLPFYYVDSFKI